MADSNLTFNTKGIAMNLAELYNMDITNRYIVLAKKLYQGYFDKDEGLNIADSAAPSEISRYSDWYEYLDEDDNVHRRKTLGMDKTIAEYIVKNIYAELPEINITNKTVQTAVDAFIFDNSFFENEVQLVETQIVLGGRAHKFYADGKIKLDFIMADRILKIPYKDGIASIFITTRERYEDNKRVYYTLLEIHTHEDNTPLISDDGKLEGFQEKPGYVIKRELYKGEKAGLFSDSCFNADYRFLFGSKEDEWEVVHDTELELYNYGKNPITNNKNLVSDLGIGLFMNSFNNLYQLDEAYDNKSIERSLGQFRLMVPEDWTNEAPDAEGVSQQHFNMKKRLYQSFPTNDAIESKPVAFTPDLRMEQIIMDINNELDMLSIKINITPGTFRFDGKSVITATQVITEKSDTARTIKQFENNLTKDYKNIILKYINYNNILATTEPGSGYVLLPEITEADITVNWKDNIIVNDAERQQHGLDLFNSNVIDRFEYLVKYEDWDETDAKALDTKFEEKANEFLMASQDDEDDNDEDNPKEDVEDGDTETKE